MSSRGERIWPVPLGLYLLLGVAPALATLQAFGRIPTGFAIWLWAILAGAVLAATAFGRRHPVVCVRPLAWRAQPWLFAGRTLFLWGLMQLGSGEYPAHYRAAGLGVAALFVLLATPADAPGVRSDRLQTRISEALRLLAPRRSRARSRWRSDEPSGGRE